MVEQRRCPCGVIHTAAENEAARAAMIAAYGGETAFARARTQKPLAELIVAMGEEVEEVAD